MEIDFKPIITKAGVNELGRTSASEAMIKLKITQLGLGKASYDATGDEVSLKDEIKRYQIADARWDEGKRLHLSVLVTGNDDAFTAGELGIFTDSGVLFAIQSKKDQTITSKQLHDDLLISIDLIVDTSLRDKIEVVGVGERLNLSVADDFVKIATLINNLETKIIEDRNKIEELQIKIAKLEK